MFRVNELAELENSWITFRVSRQHSLPEGGLWWRIPEVALTFASVAWARRTLRRILSAEAVQTNGFGVQLKRLAATGPGSPRRSPRPERPAGSFICIRSEWFRQLTDTMIKDETMSIVRRAGSVVVAFSLLTACEAPPVAPVTPEASLQLQASETYPVFPSERPFVELARQVPGFGGFFVEANGDLIAYLTDPAHEEALRPLLQPLLQAAIANRGTAAGARIIVRPARYDFLQLRLWRDQLTDPVLSTPGVTFLDLDERENRVVIGIHDSAARSSLERVILAVGVPQEAVVLKTVGQNIRDSGETLRARVRPVIGGLQNNYVTSGGLVPTVPCTIGFNADWNGQRVWLTNSHCTENERAVTSSTQYNQPSWVTDAFIGTEAHDPKGDLCGTLWSKRCRRSDAAILYHSGGAANSLGRIARPIGPPSFGFYGWPSSLEIDPNASSFRIINDDEEVSHNWFVEKVGRTTGWTSGQVIYTCVHIPHQKSDWRFLCQHGANYASGQGDSGSPVFSRVSTQSEEVRLFGIHWGSNNELEVKWFSPMSGVKHDLGSMQTVAPVQTPPPSLTVAITSPATDMVRPYAQCLYTASGSYGAPPYSYAWSVDNNVVGTGEFYYHTAGGSNFQISVTVTDANNNTAARARQMVVDYSAPECLDM